MSWREAFRHGGPAPMSSEGHLPGFDGATGWLNSPPLTAADVGGKVVLVDFWTWFDGGRPCQPLPRTPRSRAVSCCGRRLGSQLIRSVLPHGLIDEYLLLIHPLVLGSGQRLFDHDNHRVHLRLVKSTATTTGVIIATYER